MQVIIRLLAGALSALTGALLAIAILATPAKAAEFQNGLELLVACSPTETSPQEVFDACLNTIILRVSELSGRAGHCPKIKTREDIAHWVVNGRTYMLNYWKNVGTPAEASRLSPQQTIDALLRIMGYGSCIDAKES